MLLYNRLTRARNRTHAAWGDVDSELRRRADLVPELNAAVAAYAEHERSALEAATEARSAAHGDDPAARAAAEQRLGSAIGGVVGIAEAYPELRASERFAQLAAAALAERGPDRARAHGLQRHGADLQQRDRGAAGEPRWPAPLGFRRRDLFELADGRA